MWWMRCRRRHYELVFIPPILSLWRNMFISLMICAVGLTLAPQIWLRFGLRFILLSRGQNCGCRAGKQVGPKRIQTEANENDGLAALGANPKAALLPIARRLIVAPYRALWPRIPRP